MNENDFVNMAKNMVIEYERIYNNIKVLTNDIIILLIDFSDDNEMAISLKVKNIKDNIYNIVFNNKDNTLKSFITNNE